MKKNILKTLLILLLSFNSYANTQNFLNGLLEFYNSEINRPNCSKMLDQLENIKSEVPSEFFERIKSRLENICSDGVLPWNSGLKADLNYDALCDNSGNLKGCQWRKESARGYFILKQPSYETELNINSTPSKWPLYLVCAHGIHNRTYWIFGERTVADARCVISDVVWDFYPKDGSNYRSDIRGFYKWMDETTLPAKIIIPDELIGQCHQIFSDAIYCTPTLIVLPTLEKDTVDVCNLHAEDKLANAIIVKILIGESAWNCKRVKIEKVSSAISLDNSEKLCVPKKDGSVKTARCALPYIPRKQEIHLISRVTCPRIKFMQTPHRYNIGSVCEHPEAGPFVPIRDLSGIEDADGFKILDTFISFNNEWMDAYPRGQVKDFLIKGMGIKKIHITCEDGTRYKFQPEESGITPNNCPGQRARSVSLKLDKNILDPKPINLYGRI